MDASKLRIAFLIFAAALFFFAFTCTDGGPNRDWIKASIAIGLCVGGCVSLVCAANVKKDS